MKADPSGPRCTSHHHACDCREWGYARRIAEMEDEIERLRSIERAANCVVQWDWSDNDADCVADIVALAEALNRSP